MAEELEFEGEAAAAGMMATAAHSERDVAQGVTRWLSTNFHSELAAAVASTPFSIALLCAIACREAGIYWLPLTPRRPAAEILGLCVYDASGDVAGAPRSAFPVNTAQFRLAYGDAFTRLLITETNKARAARGLNPAAMVYKGYGIFQYDLQHVRADEAFFREKRWYSFSECVRRAVAELTAKFQATGDIQKAVRAYNGSGPRAEQYARDVMRLLPYCEEELATGGPAAFTQIAAGGRPALAEFDALAIADEESAAIGGEDDDPGYPESDAEIYDIADFDAARSFANLGVRGASDGGGAEMPSFLATGDTIALDTDRARAFLKACQTSRPRVTYGLGAKVPFLGAVPGRNFTKVDCSGFVREAIRLSTSPTLRFPDGSVVQHDWVRARGLASSTIAEGKRSDGLVRIAFLRPQDSPSRIGHVVLISDGRTLESHSGVGPNSRVWDGTGWQAKARVYVLGREARRLSAGPASVTHAAATPVPELMDAQPMAATYTVRTGRRYRARVTLGVLEQFASNDKVGDVIAGFGFSDVVVTGSGRTRQAEATWSGADTTAPIDARLSDIAELPRVAALDETVVLSAPAIIRGAETAPSGRVAASVFTTESLPEQHDGLLVVNMKRETLRYAPKMAMMEAAGPVPETRGLEALAFLDRAGRVKVTPLRERAPTDEPPAKRLEAAAALTFSARPVEEADASSGVHFIEMTDDSDTKQLLDELARDPNVASASRVPVRYLAARRPARAGKSPGAGIAATPPAVPVLWNLEKIQWAAARGLPHFQEAREVRVAVLDTGVDDKHPDLKIDRYHWQHPDLSRPASERDIIGHGTHVGGTIAALINNGPSVQGICECRLSAFKIFDDEPSDAPGQGAFVYYVNPIMYRRALSACIDDPVDVINLSIGGPGAPDATELDLFQQLVEAGVTICAAMGNERQYRSPTSYPAAIRGVIAVGATGLDDRVTAFSNAGNHIALAAPGKAIWSTLPTYSGQTSFGRAFGTDGRPKPGAPVRREINYDAWDGTSMATPHVAGCAALFLARQRAAGKQPTPADVRDALMKTADKVAGMGGSSFSADYGAGRLNMFELLK